MQTMILKVKSVEWIHGVDNAPEYTVFCEAVDGSRWTHSHIFAEDFGGDRAEMLANRLVERVKERGTINIEHWQFHSNAYGSEAWQVENDEACAYADLIRFGMISENDVPSNIAVLL